MDKYQRFLHENTKGIDSVCELGAGLFKNLAIEAQRHKSTWYKEDFEALGFTVDEDHTFMGTPAPFHDIGEDGGSVLWAVWNK